MAEAIYVYHSTNDFLLNHTIEEKVKEFKVDPFNILKYDLLENPSDDILEDLQTVSFFAEKKVIIIRNLQEIEKEPESVLKSWVSYFQKPNPDFTDEMLQLLVLNGVYPYDYMSGVDQFRETKLPDRKELFSRLTKNECSEKDCEHAQEIWKAFKCETMLDYHNLYLKNRRYVTG